MRSIYLLLIASVIAIILLLAGAFYYFEATSHKNYYYMISSSGNLIGEEEVDKYITDENIIYKAKQNAPFAMDFDKWNSRLVLGRASGNLRDYEIESSNDRFKQLYMLKKSGEGFDFLAIAKSKYSLLYNIEFKKKDLPFSRRNISTLYPIIKSYKYNKGGAQYFNVIRFHSDIMPPYETSISLTSIRDEFLKINNARIKTECLVIKEGDNDIGRVWVSKSGHDIMAYEDITQNYYYELTDKRGIFVARNYALKDISYISKRITISLDKDKIMQGILSRPKKKGLYPLVLLISGEEAVDESNYGLFVDMADCLAKNGFAVFRYNIVSDAKKVDFQAVSINDEYKAIKLIIEYFEDYRSVDTENIFLIAHADANYFLPGLILNEKRIKGWVMLNPKNLAPVTEVEAQEFKNYVKTQLNTDVLFYDNVISANENSLITALQSTKYYTGALSKKIYTGRIKEIAKLDSLNQIRDVNAPILIIQGKNENRYDNSFMKAIESNFENRPSRTIIYFRKLNYYLGHIETSPIIKAHYIIDKEALETICGWLKQNIKA